LLFNNYAVYCNMYMNFFLKSPEKKLALRPKSLPENAQPYQLSGCKYKKVIFSPQIVLPYFFSKKTHKTISSCLSS
ncbi:hypothetical protein, partial [Flagellimonas marina]